MSTTRRGSPASLITRIHQLFSEELAKENDFLR
jgi:hypothetical protein